MGLREKIEDRSAKVGIMGLGYVGLPPAVEFGKAGYAVYGIDVDSWRAGSIREGKSYIQDVHDKDLSNLISAGRLTATTNYTVLKEMDAISICVPTPLRKTREGGKRGTTLTPGR